MSAQLDELNDLKKITRKKVDVCGCVLIAYNHCDHFQAVQRGIGWPTVPTGDTVDYFTSSTDISKLYWPSVVLQSLQVHEYSSTILMTAHIA